MREKYLNISEYLYVMDVHALFKVLGDKKRLEIVNALLSKKMCVSKINRCVGTTQPNISQHLKALRNAGIVKLERRGKECCYYIAKSRELKKLVHYAKKVVG